MQRDANSEPDGVVDTFETFNPYDPEPSAFRFWNSPARWPVDGIDHVFLTRSVNAIGSVVFPESWSDDIYVRHLPMFAPRCLPRNRFGPEQGYALALLEMHRPDLRIDPSRIDRLDAEPLSAREWSDALDAFDQFEREPRTAAARRVDSVLRLILQACANGELLTATRELQGNGEFRPILPAAWNVDGSEERFAFCLMHPEKLSAEGMSAAPATFWKTRPWNLRTDVPSYVYVLKSSHVAFVGSLSSQPPTPRVTGSPKALLIQRGKKAAERLIADWIAAGSVVSERPSREEFVAAIRASVGNELSQSVARELYMRLAPLDWRKPGPRGSRRNPTA